MRNKALKNETIQHVVELLPGHQRQVLDFVRALESIKLQGVTGKSILSFAGTVPPEDLDVMSDAIELGCEQVAHHKSGFRS